MSSHRQSQKIKGKDSKLDRSDEPLPEPVQLRLLQPCLPFLISFACANQVPAGFVVEPLEFRQ